MKIVVADDDPRVRKALRLLLEQQPAIRVIAEVGDFADLLTQVRVECPEVLLVDWGVLSSVPQSALATLRRSCPLSRVVVMSGRAPAEEEALAAGADACVLKVDPPEWLLRVLQETAVKTLNQESEEKPHA